MTPPLDSSQSESWTAHYFAKHPHRNLLAAVAIVTDPDNSGSSASSRAPQQPQTLCTSLYYEYCPETLSGLFAKQHGTVEEDLSRGLLQDLLRGLTHLHRLEVTHQDLNPANLFIQWHGRWGPCLKIGDLPLSLEVPRASPTSEREGANLRYRAPEIWLRSDSSTRVDVWSAGMVARELMTGWRLHDMLEIGQTFDLDLGLCMAAGGPINESNWPGCSQLPSFQRSRAPAMAPVPLELERRLVWRLDPEGHALVRGMLSIQPESRPTAAEAATSPYFAAATRPLSRLPSKTAVSAMPYRQPPPLRQETAAMPPHVTPMLHYRSDGFLTGMCRCTYKCGNVHGQHSKSADGKRLCTKSSEGGTYCRYCECERPQCHNAKYGQSYCNKHQVHHCGDDALILMATLAPTLTRLTPMDVEAFLAIPPQASPFLLCVLAQLWEPLAVQGVLFRLGANLQPSVAVLKKTVESVIRALSDELKANSSEGRILRARGDVLKENGTSRLLGVATVAQRLDLIQESAEGQGELSLGIGAETYNYKADGRGIERLEALSRVNAELPLLREAQAYLRSSSVADVAAADEAARCVLHSEGIASTVAAIDRHLRSLPGWAQMGPTATYIRPHVVRKVTLWLHRHFSDQSRRALPRDLWHRLCPDEGGHLSRIPADWSMERVHLIARRIDPMYYSMWCCLLGAALRLHGAETWFGRDPNLVAEQWNQAALELEAAAPDLTPSCRQVTVLAMERFPVP